VYKPICDEWKDIRDLPRELGIIHKGYQEIQWHYTEAVNTVAPSN
jgi:hypothetical protein